MSALAWRSFGAVNPHRLGEARRQAHNAAQWLVRLARSYMAPQPHAQHTLLQWDSHRQALVTQEFLPQLTVELRIPELALQFKEDGRAVPHVIKLDDRTPAEVEAWSRHRLRSVRQIVTVQGARSHDGGRRPLRRRAVGSRAK